jgi:hypothetical protein
MTLRTWSLVLAMFAGCDASEVEIVSDGEVAAADGLAAVDTREAAPLQAARDTAITYVLAWSWEGARREGGAWVFESDLGYTIGITAAHSAISQVALVPCEGADAAREAGGPAAWAVDLVVGTAHAAHGGTPDASTAAEPIVEWWGEEARVFGAAKAGGGDYCELHVVSAPIAGAAADGTAFAGETLVLTGFWSAPGEGERHGLKVSVNLSDGRVRPLARMVEWPREAAGEGLAVVIERRPARAFDGLALERLSDVELAYEALGGVLQSAEVTVARRDE